MTKEEYYKTFSLSKVPKKVLKNEELANLYTVPKKDKVRLHIQTWIADAVYQADLLMMPEDSKGYKYILMYVDLATRKVDRQPFKTREAKAVLKGFKAIFKRKHLKYPSVRLEVDDGNGFKAEVKQYFKKLKVHVRVEKPGRHRQQSLVKCANKLIGQALHQRMAAQELLTGEVSRE